MQFLGAGVEHLIILSLGKVIFPQDTTYLATRKFRGAGKEVVIKHDELPST